MTLLDPFQRRSTVEDLTNLESYFLSNNNNNNNDDDNNVLDTTAIKKKRLDYALALKYLSMQEEHQLRKSEMVFKCGQLIIEELRKRDELRSARSFIINFFSSLNTTNSNVLRRISVHERAQILEQTFISALDLNELKRALELFDALKEIVIKQLGQKNSRRLRRLEGMLLESSGEFDKALVHYDEILKDHPTEQRVMKRKIAVYEQKNDKKKLLECLNEYLDVYMDDVEAWEHAGKIYSSLFMHEQAIFCFEECLCSSPSNYHNHRRVAEQLYALSGIDNLKRASMYYAAAIDMSTGADVRSLYGCILTRNKLQALMNNDNNNSSVHTNKNSLDTVEALASAAVERLEQMYAIKQEELLGFVRQLKKKN